jgi:4a-hydroxytetrahydrobiopterin dehydratase
MPESPHSADLAHETCEPCRRGSPTLTTDQIDRLRSLVPQWQVDEVAGVPRLVRRFKLPDFRAAMAFAAQIGDAAESEGHHPVLTVEWGAVGVQWWTHKIRGLHRNDFVMAARTDALFEAIAAGGGS